MGKISKLFQGDIGSSPTFEFCSKLKTCPLVWTFWSGPGVFNETGSFSKKPVKNLHRAQFGLHFAKEMFCLRLILIKRTAGPRRMFLGHKVEYLKEGKSLGRKPGEDLEYEATEPYMPMLRISTWSRLWRECDKYQKVKKRSKGRGTSGLYKMMFSVVKWCPQKTKSCNIPVSLHTSDF